MHPLCVKLCEKPSAARALADVISKVAELRLLAKIRNLLQ
jgi:hypothetical protein